MSKELWSDEDKRSDAVRVLLELGYKVTLIDCADDLQASRLLYVPSVYKKIAQDKKYKDCETYKCQCTCHRG